MTELAMQNLQVGITITFIGMIVVLAFPTLMIYVIEISNKVIIFLNKLFPEVIKEQQPKKINITQGSQEATAMIILWASGIISDIITLFKIKGILCKIIIILITVIKMPYLQLPYQ